MTFPPREGDRTVPEIEAIIEQYAAQGAECWVKWTCPGCGDRCLSDTPNLIQTGGYTHTERADGSRCGAVYTELRFGVQVEFHFPKEV